MAREFDVEWDDFSGGHWFGNRDTKQPQNTWTGDNVILVAADGTLMPGAPLVIDPDATSISSINTLNPVDYGYCALNGDLLSYPRRTGTSTRVFVHNGVQYSIGAQNPGGGPVHFNGKIIFPSSTVLPGVTLRLQIFDPAALSITDVAVPVIFANVYAWDAWALGVAASSNRIYFCAPYDETSWDSNDYIDVGDADAYIQTIVPTVNGILVGTATGWWQITGVLGQTTQKRQITSKGVTTAGGVEVDAGVLFGAGGNPDQAAVRLLSGTLTPTALWDPSAGFGSPERIVRVGGHYVFVITDDGGVIYMWSEHTRTWRRIQALTAAELSYTGGDGTVKYRVASDPGAGASQAFLAARGTLASNNLSVRIYTYDIDPFDPPVNSAGTAYQSATVDLAAYDHKRPFRVKELIAEVDCGTTSLNATRSLALAVKAPGKPIDNFATITGPAANASAAQTWTLPAMASTAGERAVYRFNPTDTGESFNIIPQLTMRGVKLRRVIARCQEAA
jgi:hypothetical protein